MKRILIAFAVALFASFAFFLSVSADDGTPPDTTTSATSAQHYFYHLVFPSERISSAILGVFGGMAEDEALSFSTYSGVWMQVFGQLLQSPESNIYSKLAQSSWPVAAALAPALFLLRIALYNWGRLVGEQDSPMTTAGDILTALMLAVVSGWFLDFIVRLGWWVFGAVVGESGTLFVQFVQSISVGWTQAAVSGTSGLFSPILGIGLLLGGLIALVGLLFAFVAAQTALFLLAHLGPSVAIMGVIPQLRWLRSLWIKAATVVALLPLVAGGIFKAGVSLGGMFDGSTGVLGPLLSVFWLFGASGALLSLAGVVGKMTISSATEAVSGVVKAVGAIAATATGVGLVGAAAGTAAVAGTAATAGTTAGSTTAATTSTVAATGAASAGGLSAPSMDSLVFAQTSIQSARAWEARAGIANLLGFRGYGAYARSKAAMAMADARAAELRARMDGLSSDYSSRTERSIEKNMLAGYNGKRDEFSSSLQAMNTFLMGMGRNGDAMSAIAPVEFGKLVRAYHDHRQEIEKAPDPWRKLIDFSGVNPDLFG